MTISKKSFLFPAALVFYEIATYLSNDMYLPSLPQISRDMQLSQDLAEQTLLFWFLGSASMQLLMGPLSDRYGRKIILMIGGMLYVLSSLTCAMTANISLFLLARFMQGSAVCSMVVAGYAAIHELYDTKQAIKIIAMMGSVSILAPAFGPLLGAIVLTFFDWQAIFYLLAGWSLVAMLLIGVVMPETNLDKIKIDFKEITRDFITIAKRRAFLCYALPFCLIFLSFICWIVESPFIIIETYHKTPLEYGYIQLAIFGAFIVGTQIVHYCAEKVPTIHLINSGMCIALIAVLLLVIASYLMPQALYLLVFLLMLFSLGAAIAFAPLNRSAIDACQEPMGRRMAIFSTYMNVFGVIATALITLVNDKTMGNLAIVIALGTFIAFIYFQLSYRKI